MGVDDLVGVAGRAYTRGHGVAQAGNHLEITGGKSLGDVQILDTAWIILSHKLVFMEALFIFSLSPESSGHVVPTFV